MTDNTAAPPVDGPNFIEAIIEADNASGKHQGRVLTRFPPEPNGYLHLGHAKSICLNFGLGIKFGGKSNLRFDDTNPLTEEVEYVDSIQADVRWLGFQWDGSVRYASDYFDALYLYAEELIKMGKAYVCSLSPEEISEYRGDFFKPGRDSPYRNRSVDENLQLFRDMKAGKYPDGAHCVRLKIDMASGNPNMRDPPIYRIRHAKHHRSGSKWCVYPLYDYTHCISDALEAITHSICTTEFESHRPLYDWVLEHLRKIPPGSSIEAPPGIPQQIEFSRLNTTYVITSKRKLLQLVNDKLVAGWDDPRMPTIAGIRRRGYPAAAVRAYANRTGVSKHDTWTDYSILEECVREELNAHAPRAMAVMNPLKVVIENIPEGKVEMLSVPNHPQKPELGVRQVPFAREIYIEREDFEENPPKGYFRLQPGKEVRLRMAYFIKCERIIKDDKGHITELRCTYDPATKGGEAPDGRKVKGTIHWVSVAHAAALPVRLYDRLFNVEHPGKGDDWKRELNPHSLQLSTAYGEPMLATLAPSSHVQFERVGYFFADPLDSKPGAPVFNRVVTLKDGWAKEQKKTS
jgi:glutaminyl-tRNA synthetase